VGFFGEVKNSDLLSLERKRLPFKNVSFLSKRIDKEVDWGMFGKVISIDFEYVRKHLSGGHKRM